MPHIVIECPETSRDPKSLVKNIFEAAASTGLFNAPDIKTRLYHPPYYQLGASPTGYIHITASILEGRTEEQKKALSAALFAAARPYGLEKWHITVDIRDMQKATYSKAIIQEPL